MRATDKKLAVYRVGFDLSAQRDLIHKKLDQSANNNFRSVALQNLTSSIDIKTIDNPFFRLLLFCWAIVMSDDSSSLIDVPVNHKKIRSLIFNCYFAAAK